MEASLENIPFRAFAVKTDDILIYITNISICGQKKTIKNYIASFIGEYKKKRALYVQKIQSGNCEISIHQKDHEAIFFFGSTPTEAWQNVEYYKKYHGTQLFGLEHPMTRNTINEQ